MGLVWAELGGRLGLQFLLKTGVEWSRRLSRNAREKEGSPRSWNHSVSEKESTAVCTSLHAPKAVFWELDPWPVLLIRNEGGYLGRVGVQRSLQMTGGEEPWGDPAVGLALPAETNAK